MAPDEPPRQAARPNLADEICLQLRKEILAGVLTPGARLRVQPLAERFATSQTPIREALRLLGGDGLVIHVPRRGVYVRTPTVQDIDEIYSLRAVLEGLGARRAALRMNPAGVAALDDPLRRMEAADKRGDHKRVVEVAMELHESITELAGHERLLRMHRSILGQATLFAQFHGDHAADFAGELRAHRALRDAVVSGDPDAAQRAAVDHVAAARDDLIRRATAAGMGSTGELPDRDGASPAPSPEWALLVLDHEPDPTRN